MYNVPYGMRSPLSRANLRLLQAAAAACCITFSGHLFADDDDDGSGVPPVDPNPGYIGIFPNPTLPPGYEPDQSTNPWGVRIIFNAVDIRLIQSFRPSESTIDWAAFVVENNEQGGVFGPTTFRVNLATGMNSQGFLSGVLATSSLETIEANEMSWLRFDFAESIPVTPNQTYYLEIEYVEGYEGGPGDTGIGLGGRTNSVYSRGSLFSYWDSQFGIVNASSPNHDLIFATGTVPEPSTAALFAIAGAAMLARRSRS